mmetsp:Transcript_20727/g.44829  ORF Transcript_20727/g.44829 Transcript_20727/m.44829 type:complete len:214 (-) Transcript_20727:1257-1898(-)
MLSFLITSSRRHFYRSSWVSTQVLTTRIHRTTCKCFLMHLPTPCLSCFRPRPRRMPTLFPISLRLFKSPSRERFHAKRSKHNLPVVIGPLAILFPGQLASSLAIPTLRSSVEQELSVLQFILQFRAWATDQGPSNSYTDTIMGIWCPCLPVRTLSPKRRIRLMRRVLPMRRELISMVNLAPKLAFRARNLAHARSCRHYCCPCPKSRHHGSIG